MSNEGDALLAVPAERAGWEAAVLPLYDARNLANKTGTFCAFSPVTFSVRVANRVAPFRPIHPG